MGVFRPFDCHRRKPRQYGERPAYGEHKSYGERSGYGERKSYGEHRSYGESRPSYGDRKPRQYGERPAYGEHKSYGERPYGDRPARKGAPGRGPKRFPAKSSS